MKNFIEGARQALRTSREVVGKSLRLGIGYGMLGGVVIGGGSALFISAPFSSLFIFGAAVSGVVVGGGYALGNIVEGMWTTGDTSRNNRNIVSGALLLAASAAALYVSGTPRSAAERNAPDVSAAANAAFANCPADKRVTTITQDARGRQVVTMTCNK